MDLAIRALVAADVDWICAACQDPDIQRWTAVPVPYTRAHAEDFITMFPSRSRTWAVGQLVEQARAIPEARSVALIIAAENVASRRTAEAAGFTLVADAAEEAPDRRDHDLSANDQLVAAVRYRLELTDG